MLFENHKQETWQRLDQYELTIKSFDNFISNVNKEDSILGEGHIDFPALEKLRHMSTKVLTDIETKLRDVIKNTLEYREQKPPKDWEDESKFMAMIQEI